MTIMMSWLAQLVNQHHQLLQPLIRQHFNHPAIHHPAIHRHPATHHHRNSRILGSNHNHLMAVVNICRITNALPTQAKRRSLILFLLFPVGDKLPSPPVDPETKNPGGFQPYTGPSVPVPSHEAPVSHATLTADQVSKAQKYCKYAGSALNFDDVKSAIDNLERALYLLTNGQEKP